MTAIAVQDARVYASNAGFRGDGITTIVAIGMAESGLEPTSDAVNVDGSIDRGILQINNVYHPEVSDQCAHDPACAFAAAFTISQRGQNFCPWNTYEVSCGPRHNGNYRQFLQAASGQGPSTSVQASLQHFYDVTHISQSFGVPEMGNAAAFGYHTGVDYAWPTGTAIPALAGGTVERVTTGCPPGNASGTGNAQCGGGYGNHPEIRLPDGRLTIYGHMENVYVQQGATVQPGQIIGAVDTTGFASGPHTHVELRTAQGQPIDPTDFINAAIMAAPTAPESANAAQPQGSPATSGVTFDLASMGLLVNQQISHIQGFDGIVLATDQVEQFVGIRITNPIGSMIANASAVATRALITIMGFTIFVFALLSLANSPSFQGINSLGKQFGGGAGEAEGATETIGEGMTLPTELLAV